MHFSLLFIVNFLTYMTVYILYNTFVGLFGKVVQTCI